MYKGHVLFALLCCQMMSESKGHFGVLPPIPILLTNIANLTSVSPEQLRLPSLSHWCSVKAGA